MILEHRFQKITGGTGSSEYFVEDARTVYLVPPNNPEIMAAKILKLVRDPNKRMKMGEAGYKKVKDMCDINDYGKNRHL